MSTTNQTTTPTTPTTPITTTTAVVVEDDPCETVFHTDGECDDCKCHSERLTAVISYDRDEVLGALIWVCPTCRREILDAEDAVEAEQSLAERLSDVWDKHYAHADARRAAWETDGSPQ